MERVSTINRFLFFYIYLQYIPLLLTFAVSSSEKMSSKRPDPAACCADALLMLTVLFVGFTDKRGAELAIAAEGAALGDSKSSFSVKGSSLGTEEATAGSCCWLDSLLRERDFFVRLLKRPMAGGSEVVS